MEHVDEMEPCEDGTQNHRWKYGDSVARCADGCRCEWDGFMCEVCDAVVTQLTERAMFDRLSAEADRD